MRGQRRPMTNSTSRLAVLVMIHDEGRSNALFSVLYLAVCYGRLARRRGPRPPQARWPRVAPGPSALNSTAGTCREQREKERAKPRPHQTMLRLRSGKTLAQFIAPLCKLEQGNLSRGVNSAALIPVIGKVLQLNKDRSVSLECPHQF